MKIVSFNLRYDKPDPGERAWTIRRNAVAAVIYQEKPDIIGTQEGKAHQLLDLHRLLPEYQSLGKDRRANGTDEYCAIFYRQQNLRCLQAGDFWLSQTPEIPGSISIDWGNQLPRMVTWGILATGEGQKITVFNTHLDYESQPARELSIKLIHSRLSSLNAAESLIVLTGDFNCGPDSVARTYLKQPLKNGVQLLDALADVELEHQMTYHEFTGKGFDAVDTIYYDCHFDLQAAKVETSSWQGIFPSDHFPAIATLEPKPKEISSYPLQF